MDDRQQPRLHAASPLDVAGGIPPRPEEGVLDDVLGEGRVIRDAVGDRVGHRLVALVQVIESPELSVGDAHQDSPIRVVRDRGDAQRQRPGGLAHLLVRTRAGFGSLRSPSRSSATEAIAAATVSTSAVASMTATRSGSDLRDGQEPVAHPVVEGEIELGLEAGHVARRLAREPGLDRQVEQDRQVRA